MKSQSKYVKAFQLGLQNSLEYRANFILSLISTVFPMVIQYYLWTAVYNNSQNASVYGYKYNEMIAYTILAGIISKLVACGFEWEVADDIKNGGLNKYIVKPIGYFQYRISCFFGQKSPQLAIILVLIAIILYALKVLLGLELELLRIFLFIVASLLALTLNFLISFAVSTLAFWISEAGGVFVVLGLLINIASGGIFPLDIFGDKVAKVIEYLPFKYIIYYPVNILNGRMAYNEIFSSLPLQIIWIAVIFTAARLLWAAGSKKYIAVGG